MSTRPYRCPKHDVKGITSWCPACKAEFDNRQPAADMTIEERVATLRAIPEVLTIPFDCLHQWVEELMGRGVWTHEFAYPEKLIDELQSGQSAEFGDVMAKLPRDKPVILVDVTSGRV